MDAKSFSTYLKNILNKEAQNYEGNILSANYEKRIGGIRDTLIGISSSLDKVLEDFYAQGGSSSIIETSKDA